MLDGVESEIDDGVVDRDNLPGQSKYAELATFRIFMVSTGSWSMTFTKSFGLELMSEVKEMTFCTLAGNAGMRSHISTSSGATVLTSKA